MKKLMIAAAATAMIGGAFAAQVADYRATVKYVDMQRWTRTISVGGQRANQAPYVKVVKITTLRGYVVYNDCACQYTAGLKNLINPAFLVVKSFAQPSNDALPWILPADLLVRMIDQTCGLADATDEIGAEGYLFAGAGKGSVATGGVAPVAPWMADKNYGFGSRTLGTRHLFGKFNEPQGTEFYDAWLDHAGFGSAWYNTEEGGCAEDSRGYCLKKLMGYLIGGSYLCHPNGFPFVGFDWFPCHEWLGTTDVVTGYWGMRRIAALEPANILPADGRIFIEFNKIANADATDTPVKALMRDTLGQVKSLVSYMTSGKQANLAFINDDATAKTLVNGFEYEVEK